MQRSVILCNNPPYYNLIFIAQTAMNRRHCWGNNHIVSLSYRRRR